MAKWRLCKALIQLKSQVDAAHPNRSKKSDGSIGDQAHAARTSDHNPNAQGVVTAIDVTHDPEHGVNGLALAESLKYDPRVKYLIFAGRIWKARTGIWEDYHGTNSHHRHLHISVDADPKSYDSSEEWDLGDTKETPAEARITAGENAPEPVVEQPKDPPPKEINAQTATTVNASKPSILGQISSITIPAGLTTAIATIGKLFMGIPPWAWALIIAVGIIAAAYLWNEKRKRAHERTLKIADIAADPKSNNVYLGGGENK